ncbi:MAG: cell envelope integrity protein CreD [bacterium]
MQESKLRSSVMLRMIIVIVLTIILLIPTLFVQLLVSEREKRRDGAVKEVSQKWGGVQRITGPVLSLPVVHTVKDENGKEYSSLRYYHILPDSISLSGDLQPTVRYRGIYEAVLYNTVLSGRGSFSLTSNPFLQESEKKIVWKDAVVTIGVSDLKGIREEIAFRWNSTTLSAEPGSGACEAIKSGVTFKPNLSGVEVPYLFDFTLALNGSSELQITSVGKQTEVALVSSWRSPSFNGAFLPVTREISDNGFQARWKVLHLNRNYPQHWMGEQLNLDSGVFGVQLLLVADEYQKTMRTIKYAVLFIALTFLSFFLTEILAGQVFHPIHYSLIGLALVLFYIVLLSLSEHMRFQYAYPVSTIVIVGLISAYTKAISRNGKVAVGIGGFLAVLYTFLYVVLQLEDYALLIGSGGLLLILALVMYLTRAVDWFSIGQSKETR